MKKLILLFSFWSTVVLAAGNGPYPNGGGSSGTNGLTPAQQATIANAVTNSWTVRTNIFYTYDTNRLIVTLAGDSTANGYYSMDGNGFYGYPSFTNSSHRIWFDSPSWKMSSLNPDTNGSTDLYYIAALTSGSDWVIGDWQASILGTPPAPSIDYVSNWSTNVFSYALTTTSNNSVYLSPNGDDLTGVIGEKKYPFRTISAASQFVTNGCSWVFSAGDYDGPVKTFYATNATFTAYGATIFSQNPDGFFIVPYGSVVWDGGKIVARGFYPIGPSFSFGDTLTNGSLSDLTIDSWYGCIQSTFSVTNVNLYFNNLDLSGGSYNLELVGLPLTTNSLYATIRNCKIKCFQPNNTVLSGSSAVVKGIWIQGGVANVTGCNISVSITNSAGNLATAAITATSGGIIYESGNTIDLRECVPNSCAYLDVKTNSITNVGHIYTWSAYPKSLLANGVSYITSVSTDGSGLTNIGTSGTAILIAGTNQVSTTAIQYNSKLFLTYQSLDGNSATIFYRTNDIFPGASFTIRSSSGTDTNKVNWFIVP